MGRGSQGYFSGNMHPLFHAPVGHAEMEREPNNVTCSVESLENLDFCEARFLERSKSQCARQF